jgi:DegV family protein with EDD domain
MSPQVAVVTDSAASLPSGIAEEMGITVVPIYLRFGDRAVPDDEGPERFYERLRSATEGVSTAAPAPGDFLGAFEGAGSEHVLCLTIASSVSGIHRSAVIAAGEAAVQVEVVDSGTAAMAQGFVAMEAARVARGGADLSATAARAREVAARSRLIAAVDSFEYLRRSGRVSRLASYAGGMLNIRPVFRMQGGLIEAVARPRTRRRALDRMDEEAGREIGDRPVHLAAVHADAEAEARALLERISEGREVVESHLAGLPPVLGAHMGPGTVGLAWFCDAAPLAAKPHPRWYP